MGPNCCQGRRRSVLGLPPKGVLFIGRRVVSGQPESTGVKPPVATLSTGSSTTGLTPTSTSSGGGGSNVGAIAGGVVGGLAGLGMLVAFAVWFIMKKTRSKVAPSSAFMSSRQTPSNYDHPNYEPPPVSARPLSPPQVVYNPSDPSTFPTMRHDSSTGGAASYPQTLYDPQAPRRGQYSGAPEV